jgi:hypothetical protein
MPQVMELPHAYNDETNHQQWQISAMPEQPVATFFKFFTKRHCFSL